MRPRSWCYSHLVIHPTAGTRSATLDITPSVPVNLQRTGCRNVSCVCCARAAGVRGPALPAHTTYPSWWGLPGGQEPRRGRTGTPAPTLNLGVPYPTHVDDGEWEREKLMTKLRLGEGRRWGPTPAGPSVAAVGCGIGDVRRTGGGCGCGYGCSGGGGGGGGGSACCGGAMTGGGTWGPISAPVVPLRRALTDDDGVMREVDAFLTRHGILG
jgi:hypothetical protein